MKESQIEQNQEIKLQEKSETESLVTKKTKNTQRKSFLFKFIKKVIYSFYKKRKLLNLENIPQNEPVIIVGNHAQIHGPFTAELLYPYKRKTWCIGHMLHLKEIPAYVVKDFWPYKSKFKKPFYKLLSYLIAPLLYFVHKNANTIGVYKDSRVLKTFKETVIALQQNEHVIIYPECHTTYNNIVNEFQTNFVDVAKLFYKKTNKSINFVPMYIAPKLKQVTFGKSIVYNNQNDIQMERIRICEYLKTSITKLAQELPTHTVVPYANIPKKQYPKSK